MKWYYLLLIIFGSLLLLFALTWLFYKPFFKRFWDFFLSFLALTMLMPIFFILALVGSIAMKGNPFFTQKRPGRIDKKSGKEKIFSLIKFRTMSNAKDKDGNLLPDEKRLNGYGKFLRSTSLDELPELINIFLGQLSIVGPRPLLVSYLDYYTEEEHHRHDVRPGLTGYAQVHGRNYVTWEEKFKMDLWYVNNISLLTDLKILFSTVAVVLKRENIETASSITHDGVIYQPLDVERSKASEKNHG